MRRNTITEVNKMYVIHCPPPAPIQKYTAANTAFYMQCIIYSYFKTFGGALSYSVSLVCSSLADVACSQCEP